MPQIDIFPGITKNLYRFIISIFNTLYRRGSMEY
jgi:hypothetical protein